MQLKIMDDTSLGGTPRIKVYGAVEWGHNYPPGAMWFTWHLGKARIEASYYSGPEAPTEAHLTVETEGDTILEMIEQIKAMLKKRGKK